MGVVSESIDVDCNVVMVKPKSAGKKVVRAKKEDPNRSPRCAVFCLAIGMIAAA